MQENNICRIQLNTLNLFSCNLICCFVTESSNYPILIYITFLCSEEFNPLNSYYENLLVARSTSCLLKSSLGNTEQLQGKGKMGQEKRQMERESK